MPSTEFDTLVDVDWLESHADDPDLVILDCSVVLDPDQGGTGTSGREHYERGHVPGAVFADLTVDLSDPDSELAYALPSPEAFCAAMERLGVGDESTVVLYDRSTGFWAARVWWMLRWVGFDRAALLDGGLRAWTATGNPLSMVEPRPVRQPHLRKFHLLMPLFICRRWEGVPQGQENQALKWVRATRLRDYPMPAADEPLIPPSDGRGLNRCDALKEGSDLIGRHACAALFLGLQPLLKAFSRDERGATAIEYGLIAAVISIAFFASLVTLGGTVEDDVFGMFSTSVDNALGGGE